MAVARGIAHPFREDNSPDGPTLWWYEVDSALASGRVLRARRFLRWILVGRPDDESAWLRLAELASSRPAQVAYLRRAYAFHPQSKRVLEALRIVRARQLEARGGKLERRPLALRRLPGKGPSPADVAPVRLGRASLPPGRHRRERAWPWTNAGRGLRIAAAAACTLVALTLLPVLAGPYGSIDRRASDPPPAAQVGGSSPAAFAPQPAPAPSAAGKMPASGLLVARVDGQGVALETFQRETAEFLASRAIAGTGRESEALAVRLPAFRRQVLDQLIDDVLIRQAAAEMGIDGAAEEVYGAGKDAPGGCMEGRFQGWQEETGQAWTLAPGIDRDERLRQAVQDRVTAGADPAMEMVRARQIVLSSKQDAWDVLVRLAGGEDFARLARETSLDPQTRDQGGDLGWFPRGLGTLPPEVEEAAFAGAPGQIQGPIHLSDRYILVQTLDHEDERPLDPDTRQALQALEFEKWLAGRRQAAGIELLIDLDPAFP